MSQDTLQERVDRGAKLLDERWPGWDEEIILNDLDMANYERHVLGQLYGSYGKGRRALRIDAAATLANGFNLEHPPGQRFPDFGPINALWRQVILIRRAAGGAA